MIQPLQRGHRATIMFHADENFETAFVWRFEAGKLGDLIEIDSTPIGEACQESCGFNTWIRKKV